MTNEFHCGGTQPNILFLMVDQDRFPPVYETRELQKWRRENLVAQNLLRKNGLSFLNHYVASTACSPSRTSLYTGHYPSLHGVTQTPGAAKGSFDADLFWLDPNTVPTTGDYFRAAGYKTFWKGKWHASEPDIIIPGTKDSLPSYDQTTGVPDKKNEEIYRKADRLNEYGFSEWIGPDPHGADPRNSASSASTGTSGRDEVYADETVKLIKQLDRERHCDKKDMPWFIQCSFVNPHDIALYGMFSAISPSFNFEVDPTLPFIPPAPTAQESLHSKPSVHESYRQTYPKGLQPIHNNNFYRQLYYSLQKEVDKELLKVLTALQQSSFLDNTIVVFTSDHGEQLGSHGLYQKWYTMYEESIHVPLIIHSPALFSKAESTNMLTSHIDILPTLLGLAGIDTAAIQRKLSCNHTEAQQLVGRDLTPLIHGRDHFFRANEPLYFMTEDNVFKGLNQTNPITGRPYEQVVQPSSIEAVFASLQTGCHEEYEIWKFARYFDNPEFWSDPGVSDTTLVQEDGCLAEIVKTEPVCNQFEMYNLAEDPLETNNLADPANATDESEVIRCKLEKLLADQRCKKRLSPGN